MEELRKNFILDRLTKFEKEHNVEILLAVESGSRGWGFASEDSDYDVRFVYKHRTSEYLKLRRPRDQYDWVEGDMDYEGYDIYKFYDLLWKSNMNIIDWLFQKEIYVDKLPNKSELQEIVKQNFNRQTYISHNYGLCKNNFHKYFITPLENEPTVKRYVYCIRALLSAQYCHKHSTIAPLNFYELLSQTTTQEEYEEIVTMVELKKKTKEKSWYRNNCWQSWIENKLNIGHLKSDNLGATADEFAELLSKHISKLLTTKKGVE